MNSSELTSTIEAKRHPLIFRAIVFVVLVAISLAGLVAWDSLKARNYKLKDTGVSTANMARALAQHAEATIVSTDNIIAALVESVEETGIENIKHPRMHLFLMRRVAEQAIVRALFVIDENGQTIVNSQPNLIAGVNYSDRIYFIHHRAYADRGPFIGPPVRSRTTGDWIITVSRRLEHADGSFAGVVLATITLDFFQLFYEEFDIGDSGVIFLATDDAIMLARRPFVEKVIGSSIAKGLVFNEYRTKGPVGTVMLVSLIDRTERLYSYRHLDSYPLIVAVAVAKEDILGEWRSETHRLIMAGIILVVLISAFGAYIIVQINERDTTEGKLRQVTQQLKALAAEDSLTGLSNRRSFDAALQTEFQRGVRNRSSLALIMIDVDRFKQFNDLYGHPAGDDCLVKVADAIKAIPARPADLTARYGGEEIVVLLPDTDEDGALSIANRLRSSVEALQIPHAAGTGSVVTVSVGMASIRPVTFQGDARHLIKLADEALYKAKAQGRNQVCSASIV